MTTEQDSTAQQPAPDKCIHGGQHSWYGWYAVDEHVFDGEFRYRRECSIMGCDARQKAADVEPTGRVVQLDRSTHQDEQARGELLCLVELAAADRHTTLPRHDFTMSTLRAKGLADWCTGRGRWHTTPAGDALFARLRLLVREAVMSTKSINRPHAPHCALLCSGEETRPCDCGAVTQPRLTISLGVQSVNLLRRAIGRLDTDDQREVANLGLKDALDEFVAANAPLPLEGQLRMLLAKKNMRSTPGDEHPLPFSDVVTVISKALAVSMEPEEDSRLDEAPLGVASFGRFDEKPTGGVKHVFVLVLADTAWVTVGISSGSSRWSDPGVFWPELPRTSNRGSEHRARYVKWIKTPAGDRWSCPRAEAEELVKAHGVQP